MKKATERLAYGTNIHAVRDFYDANTGGKILWGVLGAVAIGMVVYQLQSVIIRFYNQEKAVTITEFMPASTPRISVCPDAWVTQKKAEKYNLTPTLVSIINGLFMYAGINQLLTMEEPTMEDIVVNSAITYGEEFLTKVLPLWQNEAQGSISALVDMLGLKELHSEFAYVFPGGYALTQRREITYSGVCYRFQNGVRLNHLQSTYGGVKINLRVAEEVMAAGFREKGGSGNVYELEPYFRVVLGTAEEPDVASMTEISFRYGSHYVLIWSVTKVSRVSTRRWPCSAYTASDHKNCLVSYANIHAKGRGGGLDKYLQSIGAGSYVCEVIVPETDNFTDVNVKYPCNTFVDVGGSSINIASLLNKGNAEWNQICPRACKTLSYHYTYQVKHEALTSARNETTRLEIKAAQEVGGIEIEEYLILGPEELLANVGGILGLWMGASAMSLVQIFYLLCMQRLMKTQTRAM